MKKQLERRIVERPLEVRTNEDGTYGVRGYAAVFDQEAHGEVIRSAAFNRSLEQRDDVKLLTNHDGVAMARTKSGTLTLFRDDIGLGFDAPSLDPANPDVQRLISAMSRGDLDQCSFAGYFTDAKQNDIGVREVREVQLVDVSIVTNPWYEGTSVGLTGNRSVDAELIQIRSMPEDERSLLVQALTEDDAPTALVGERGPELVDLPNGSAIDAASRWIETTTDTIESEQPRSLTVAEARALLAGIDAAA